MQALSDDVLLTRVVHGDRAAMGVLVGRHQDAVYRYACSLTADTARAEDALQQTFLDALQGAATYAGRSSVRTWMLTLTRNAVYRGARRRAGEPQQFLPLDQLGCMAGWGDPELETRTSLARQALQDALDRLTPGSREVIILRDLEGFTGPEVAGMLDITLSAVKSRLHRARLELAASLRQEADHGT